MARTPPSDSDGEMTPQDLEISALKARVDELTMFAARLAETNAIENVLYNGFSNLGELLAPLQDLSPRYKCLSEAQAVVLAGVYIANDRPNWRAVAGRIVLPDGQYVYERTGS